MRKNKRKRHGIVRSDVYTYYLESIPYALASISRYSELDLLNNYKLHNLALPFIIRLTLFENSM